LRTKISIFIIFLFFLFSGCASSIPDRSSSNFDKEYKKGLKYSIQSYSQPIDILAGNSDQIAKNNEIPKTHTPMRSKSNKITTNNFGIQIASFQNEMNAKNHLEEVGNKNSKFKFYIVQSNKLWRVVTGNFDDRINAENLLSQLKKNGFSDAWIIQF